MPPKEPLSTDPLAALGSSLFLVVLESLQHVDLARVPSVCKAWSRHFDVYRNTIWRAASIRSGVNKDAIEQLLAAENAPSPLVESGSEAPAIDLGWKTLLRQHVVLDRNWDNGCCQNKWTNIGQNREIYVLDEAQNTCILTSMADAEENEKLHVYRTEQAILRSSEPYAADHCLPTQASTSISYTHPEWRPQSAIQPTSSKEALPHVPLPRGALAFYRTIELPSECDTFRTKLQGEGTEEERPMLVAVGRNAVCLWDLEDAEKEAEVYPYPAGHDFRGGRADFNDTRLFFAGGEKIYIFDRSTQSCLFSYPPKPATPQSLVAAAYLVCLSELEDEDGPGPVPGPMDGIQPVPPLAGSNRVMDKCPCPTSIIDSDAFIGHTFASGCKNNHPDYLDNFELGALIKETEGAELVVDDFWDVRQAGSDLFYITETGRLFITRNYEAALSAADPAEQLKLWGESTITIGFAERLVNLVVEGTHVAMGSTERVAFFDARDLPDLPLSVLPTDHLDDQDGPDQDLMYEAPPIPMYTVLPLMAGVREAVCNVQLTKTKLYYIYEAGGPAPGWRGADVKQRLRTLDFTPVGEDAWPPEGAKSGEDGQAATYCYYQTDPLDDMSTPPDMPSDPLEALGSSLFLTVLSHLPYSDLTTLPSVCHAWRYHSRCNRTGIWLAACRRTGVKSELIAKLISLENTSGRQPGEAGSLDADYADWHPADFSFPSDPDPTAGRKAGEVDWKRVCQAHVVEDKNWRFGRCEERWVYPDENTMTAWRFKVDDVNNTCIMTTQDDGLIVVDLATSEILFCIYYVRDMAHIEFCKGFAVFDVDGEDLSLLVMRTQQAVTNSAHPWPSSRELPFEISSSDSRLDVNWRAYQCILPEDGAAPADSPSPLPRGAMGFYRKITPPTPCHAFRARVDGEGTPNERAVLGTAGERAVYLWDLDNEEKAPEVIPVPLEANVQVRYLEFSDDYVFLCGAWELHVFSRSTKQRVLTFPPHPAFLRQLCAAAYRVDFSDKQQVKPLPSPPPVDGGMGTDEGLGLSAVVGRVDVEGVRSDEESFVDITGIDPESLEEVEGGAQPTDYEWVEEHDFSACHFNSTDLFCSTRAGQLYIVRDYASVLAVPDAAERAKQWAQQTIMIFFGLPVKYLAVDGTHVAACTETHIFFFDTRTLPSLPLSKDVPGAPFIRLHTILSAHPSGVSKASCAQIHKSTIYYTYCTQMDSSEEEPVDTPAFVGQVPSRAATGWGFCVRGWDFSGQ